MIADLYPLTHRATAIGFFNATASIGIGLGLFLGGWLSSHFEWRTVFLMVGLPACLPGEALALVVRYAIADPPRGLSEGMPDADAPSWKDTLRRLTAMPTFRFLVCTASSCALVNYAIHGCAATFFLRILHMSPKDVGIMLGSASAVGLLLCTIGSGMLADWLGRRNIRWYMRIPGVGMLLAIPFFALALLVPDPRQSFVFYCPAIGLLSTWASPIHSMT